MKYDPREYWAERLQRKGKNYVAWKSLSGAFDKQSEVFWAATAPHLPNGGRVLDFGCGVGRFAAVLSNVVDSYDGVDINEGALKLAPELENATFTHLAEDRLPFPDATFDGAVAFTVIQHIVDPKHYANWTAELARVVRPGGWFFVIDDPQFDTSGKRIKDAIHMRRRTPEIISASLLSTVTKTGKISAEYKDSHYYFLSTRDEQCDT
jgi:ubiquinone/menaquinone biosynthesis C-methylase UbiE